jgi:hypothetical protein
VRLQTASVYSWVEGDWERIKVCQRGQVPGWVLSSIASFDVDGPSVIHREFGLEGELVGGIWGLSVEFG